MTPHADVGAYLLGALDEAEMTRFEEHLAGCAQCGRELDELSGLPPLLEEMRENGVAFARLPDGDALLHRLLADVSGLRRTRKRRRLAAVAAAAVLVVGGPTVAVLSTDGGSGGSPVAARTFATDQRSASDPATGVKATVGIADKGWGSAVDLRLSGVRGPRTCSLVAVGQDGSRQTVATWSVPTVGYGTSNQPQPLTVHGAAGLHKADISRFDVRDTTGNLLVSVRI
jgi:hypothetical protein